MFVITTIRQGNEDWTYMDLKTVGIFDTQEKALAVIENDTGDLTESNYYPYVITEEIEFGLFPDLKLRMCHKWNDSDKKWQKYEITNTMLECDGFCAIGRK